MRRQKFAILDAEVPYACSLMEYFIQHQSVPFETLVFDSEDRLEKYCGAHRLDLLLVSERMMHPGLRQLNVGRIVLLSESGRGGEDGDCRAVYKYQSSANLMAEVLECYALDNAVQFLNVRRRNMRIYGVYSPIGRCGKTCFSLALGQILSEKKRVLYLNLEDCAGFRRLLDREAPADISDVMYFVRQNRGSVMLKLNSAVQKLGDMDYIAPVFSADDLRDIRTEEWTRILKELEECSSYDVILMDIGYAVGEVFALLSQCDRIYMPICTDLVSEAKIAQFEELVRNAEYEEILEKTQKLVLPLCVPAVLGGYFPGQITAGAMGEYVRELIALEEKDESGADGN